MQALIIILVLIIISLVILCLKINRDRQPAPRIVIEVCRRKGDWKRNGDLRYHAQIQGSKLWAAGDSFYGSIGDLVNHNPEIGIDVKYLDDVSR